MTLYNCKTDGDNWRITKFTNDLEVESSYLCSDAECECPAGHRPACRHRTMLPRFITKSATSGQFFHNFEANEWIRASTEDAFEESVDEIEEELDDSNSQVLTSPVADAPAHPFTMLSLANTDMELNKTFAQHLKAQGMYPTDREPEPPPKPLRRL